ncbi:Ubiquitin carboxyl-terminal hydrolase family protein [Rhynchospora pubera]|uniref:Ubiquitin carboxyl-terminal hydrolase family protein n=1 Tax=Rhynchospora pubera TaxID=906938 RepID=A0AAV8DWS0_9POAL|nr:Ubiquitin carboxyl-terminal hydrolase family protein [Rhynchospora pubera]
MDSNLLFSSSKAFPFPLLVSSPPSSSLFSKTHVSIPQIPPPIPSFFGKTLPLQQNQTYLFQRKKTHLPLITAVVKRRKETSLDKVIQRDKKLKLVMKIRSILVGQPDRIMSVRELGKFRKHLGLTRKRRFIALLKRFPAVFEILEEGVYSLKFRLTPEAERIYLEELRVKNEMETSVITNLRKLLMMSLNKRILLDKIAHLKADLGLPIEFKNTICERYPQYFKVVRTDRGPALELTHWDPAVAVSAAELAAEENKLREIEERNLIIDRPPKFNRVKLPKGLSLSKGEIRRLTRFNEMPYISPYSDFSELKPGTAEKERHACGVVHEILSLTLEKKILVDHLTHFREEFRFSQQLRGMLIRHPDMFYVSFKGDRDSVFLREAYRNSQLVEKNKLLLLKEKMRALVDVPRFGRRGARPINGGVVHEDEVNGVEVNGVVNGQDLREEEEEDFSDIENFLVGDDSEEELEGDEEDSWSDEDEIEEQKGSNGSLNFDESKMGSLKQHSLNNKDRVPVFPDGRPRERW